MFPGNLRIVTKAGIIPLSTINGDITIWSGYDWVKAFVEIVDKDYTLDIILYDGTTIPVLPDTPVLLSGYDDYYWQRADKLVKNDCMCNNFVYTFKEIKDQERSETYWLGCIFAAGYKYGFKIKLKIPLKKKTKESIISAVRYIKDKRILGKLDYEVNPKTLTVIFNSKTVKTRMNLDGVKFNRSNMVGFVPPGVMAQNSRKRKAYCKGILDILGNNNPTVREYTLHLMTKQRAQSVRRLFRSVGIEAYATKSYTVNIKKWPASLELKIICKYPSWLELTDGIGIPTNHIYDFLNAAKSNLYKNSTTKDQIGIADFLYQKLINAEDDINIHPSAIRAGWRRLKLTPPEPVYNVTPIDNIIEHNDKSRLYYIEVKNDKHQLSGNEYILGDSVGELI